MTSSIRDTQRRSNSSKTYGKNTALQSRCCFFYVRFFYIDSVVLYFLLILFCRGSCSLGITYLMKVFSLLSLIRNLTVSNKDEDTTTLISCIAMRMYALGVPTPYCPSVGSYSRLFVLGFVRASYQINESQLHTFFILTQNHRSGAYGNLIWQRMLN